MTDSGRLFHAGQILVSIVGLPARGKTHISRSLERYLRWLGVRTKVFSLGDFRRDKLGPSDKLPADYFHRHGKRSQETEQLRHTIKDGLEDSIKTWFTVENGQVAIYDANVCRRLVHQVTRSELVRTALLDSAKNFVNPSKT